MFLNRKVEYSFVFIAVFLIYSYLYSSTIYDVPRRDQFDFVKNLIIGSSDLDFFIKALSYNRTRLIGPGDSFLFRPITMAALSLEEIFLSQYPKLIGFVSLAFISSAIMATYAIIRIYHKRIVSFILILPLLTSSIMIELISWHHITPYSLSITFIFISLLILFSKRKYSKLLAILALIFGAGAHDSFALALPLAGIAMLFIGRSYEASTEEKQLFNKTAFSFLLAPAIFQTLNALSYFYYGAPKLIGPSDSFEFSMNTPLFMIQQFFDLFSAGVIGTWFSGFIDLSLGSSALLSWEYHSSRLLLTMGGLIGGLIVTFYVFRLVAVNRRFKNNQHLQLYEAKAIVIQTTCLFLILGLCGLFLIGRVLPRGPGYMYQATYNFALLQPFWIVLFATTLISDKISEQGKNQSFLFVGFAVGLSLLLSAHQISSLNSGLNTLNKWLSSSKEGIEIEISSHRDKAKAYRVHSSNIIIASSLQAPNAPGPEGLFFLQDPGWHAGSPPSFPESLEIQFAKLTKMDGIGLFPQAEHPSRAPNEVKFYHSEDGVIWNPILFTNQPCSANRQWRELRFDQTIQTKYLKLEIFSVCDPNSHLLTLKGLKILK